MSGTPLTDAAIVVDCVGDDFSPLIQLCRQFEKERALLINALSPFIEWDKHLAATGSRPLGPSEYPEVSGMPRMEALIAVRTILRELGESA